MTSRQPSAPTIGIVTALPIECFAVQLVLADVAEANAPGDRATYYTGEVPSRDPGRPHRVVLSLLTEDGGVAAAHRCANLQRSWRVRQIVMCGIACGVPAPDHPERHVRLGDILVAEEGVVPYGHVRALADGDEEIRRPAAKPSVVLRDAARRLRVAEEAGRRNWERLLDVSHRPDLAGYRRPSPATDVLLDDESNSVVPHPPLARSGHVPGRPKVHYGRIGSGGKLIQSSTVRNQLARRYRLIGFDMEGDGVSDGAYLQGVDWFMVRGVSDYGSGKNDAWHRYAALAAAAYVHALLGQVPSIDGSAESIAVTKVAHQPMVSDVPDHMNAETLEAVVAALLAVRTMQSQAGRDRVIAGLPVPYRGRAPRARDTYHDVLGLVWWLDGTSGGLRALYDALHVIEHDSVPLRRLAALLPTILSRS